MRYRQKATILLGIFFSMLKLSSSLTALSAGSLKQFDNALERMDLEKKVADANMLIVTDGVSKFDIGLGEVIEGRRHPIFLQPNDLKNFLRSERKKNVLAVLISESGKHRINCASISTDFENFLTDLGYKKVLLMQENRSGRFDVVQERSSEFEKTDPAVAGIPSRILRCERNLDEFELPKIPILFKRSEILNFLNRSRDKELLVIELGKPFPDDSVFEEFAKSLGYKKVIFKHSEGFFQTIPKTI